MFAVLTRLIMTSSILLLLTLVSIAHVASASSEPLLRKTIAGVVIETLSHPARIKVLQNLRNAEFYDLESAVEQFSTYEKAKPWFIAPPKVDDPSNTAVDLKMQGPAAGFVHAVNYLRQTCGNKGHSTMMRVDIPAINQGQAIAFLVHVVSALTVPTASKDGLRHSIAYRGGECKLRNYLEVKARKEMEAASDCTIEQPLDCANKWESEYVTDNYDTASSGQNIDKHIIRVSTRIARLLNALYGDQKAVCEEEHTHIASSSTSRMDQVTAVKEEETAKLTPASCASERKRASFRLGNMFSACGQDLKVKEPTKLQRILSEKPGQ